mmetsp:Transcript_5664/g.16406  ORF Transcript_5664/g.16406 Transcript_5664/m.16406 type:complete len:204 (+) Transcript_5664:1085-1696(+)
MEQALAMDCPGQGHASSKLPRKGEEDRVYEENAPRHEPGLLPVDVRASLDALPHLLRRVVLDGRGEGPRPEGDVLLVRELRAGAPAGTRACLVWLVEVLRPPRRGRAHALHGGQLGPALLVHLAVVGVQGDAGHGPHVRDEAAAARQHKLRAELLPPCPSVLGPAEGVDVQHSPECRGQHRPGLHLAHAEEQEVVDQAHSMQE